MKKDTKIAIVLIVLAILIVVIPPFALKGAEFGGSMMRGARKSRRLQEITNPGSHRFLKPL